MSISKNNNITQIHETIYKHCAISPDKIAIICGERKYSYKELWDHVKAVGRWLSNHHTKESRVGLMLENSFETVCFIYGASLAGMISVPLDANIHTNNLSYILKDCSLSLIVALKKHIPKLQQTEDIQNCQVLINDDEDVLNKELRPSFNEQDHFDEIHLAHQDRVVSILYTTGTTGIKKGVMLGHKNLLAGSRNICEFMQMDSEIVESLSMPLSHSFGYARLRSVIDVGGTCIIHNGLLHPERVLNNMKIYQANALSLVPQGFAILLDFYKKQFEKIASQIKWIEIGSAFMRKSHKVLLMDLCPNALICMHYGLTEASRSAFIEFHSERTHLHTVGRPSPQINIRIVDKTSKDVEAENIGEIVIKGDTVMQGYWNKEDLTKQTLHDDWLQTGDIGFIDSHGYVHLLGRREEIINIGGLKVAPSEVEEILLKYKGIVEVAVTGVKSSDDITGNVIKAYVVTDDPLLDLKKVEQFCLENMEPYKVPAMIKKVDSLPKTSSGKIQRHLISNEDAK